MMKKKTTTTAKKKAKKVDESINPFVPNGIEKGCIENEWVK